MTRRSIQGEQTIGEQTATDQYLHRVGRAGRFGTKGLAISFIADQKDADELASVQSRFEVNIPILPDEIDMWVIVRACPRRPALTILLPCSNSYMS